VGSRASRERRRRLADDRHGGRHAPGVAHQLPLDGATIFFYSQRDTPKLRNIARSPRVSFNLRSDDHADHLLVVEGDAAVDASIVPSDATRSIGPSTPRRLAHWGMDETETAKDFSVPVRSPDARSLRLAPRPQNVKHSNRSPMSDSPSRGGAGGPR